MKCLIIAAGRGSRLVDYGPSKPLIPLCGVPLIERVIHNAVQGGIREFVIVTGYRSEPLTLFLEQLARKSGIDITCIRNQQWQKDNGLSVLAAKEVLNSPFLLQMADHLLEADLIHRLQKAQLPPDAVMLAVDRRMDNPLVDLEDVTCVQAEEGKITHIGKHLESFNAYDTGLFLCTPRIFSAIETSAATRNDTTLSGGIRTLADSGNAYIFDSQAAFWLDVDAPQDYLNAEKAIQQGQGGMQKVLPWKK